jgi:manganese/zinc/iron transport system permease protein
MIVPPAAAYLLSDRLGRVIALSAGIGALSAVLGYWTARWLDASIAGAMAGAVGIIFLVVFLVAPERGLLALARRRARQRVDFARTMLAIHLLHHEDTPEADEECRVDHLSRHLRWTDEHADRIVRAAERAGFVTLARERLHLTADGRAEARRAMTT